MAQASVTSDYARDVNGAVRCASLTQTSDARGQDRARSPARPGVYRRQSPKRSRQVFVAQDVGGAAAALGVELGGYKDTSMAEPDKPTKHLLDYSEFIAPIVSAVREL